MQNYMKTILNGFKTWVSDVVKTSTADWNQSDKEATNYIKNRTHYDDIIKTDISGATYTISGFSDGNLTVSHDTIPLELGQVWKMRQLHGSSGHWEDFVEWEVQQDEDGTLYVGTPINSDDNIVAFYLTKTELTVEEAKLQAGYSTFEFVCVSGYVTSHSTKQLDPKYIPDTIARVDDIPQPNWNQNDENAPDYIKNRPFYKTDGAYVGMGQFVATSATELKHTTAAGDEFYEVVIPYLNTISGKGEVCNIKIGENSGKISCSFDRGWFDISGMLSGDWLRWQTGEVWTLKSNNESVAFLEGSTYDIEFFNTLDPYKKMDPGYLPDIVYTSENAPVKFGDRPGSTVQGVNTISSGYTTHAEGMGSNADGEHTHAEGYYTLADNFASHAEGQETMATGDNSHAAGNHTVANQYGMYVFGDFNQVFDIWGEAVNPRTKTIVPTVEFYYSDEYTFDASTGIFTLVNPKFQTGVPVGKYCTSSPNINNLTSITKVISTAGVNRYNTLEHTQRNKVTNRGDYVHIVGNGESEDTRSNAHTLDWEGNAWYAGDVYVGSTSGTNRDEGSKKLATEDKITELAIPLPPTATIGQTLRISEVDENGKVTLVEAVDMPTSDEESFTETDPTVPDWAKAATKPTYTASEVGAEVAGTVNTHNTNTESHNDIRTLITGLTTRLNALADSDDTTLDQLSEIVAYIKANKTLIDGVTTSKVNVTDIVDNLTTNVANKPLSAAQGVAITTLIDTELAKKSDTGHTHIASEITDLQPLLNEKVSITTTINGKALSDNVVLSASDINAYTKTEIDNLELITTDDIDAICGGTIKMASEVTF